MWNSRRKVVKSLLSTIKWLLKVCARPEVCYNVQALQHCIDLVCARSVEGNSPYFGVGTTAVRVETYFVTTVHHALKGRVLKHHS